MKHLIYLFLCGIFLNCISVYALNVSDNLATRKIKDIAVYRKDMVVAIKYENDSDVKSDEVKYIPCTCNRKRTRLGEFETSPYQMYRWHPLNMDENGKRHYGQYCIRFDDNILFHSALYNEMNNPLSLEISTYNGIVDPEVESQGCVRLRVKDLKEIYRQAEERPIKVIVTDEECPVERKTLVNEESFELWSSDTDIAYDLTDSEAKTILIYSKINRD